MRTIDGNKLILWLNDTWYSSFKDKESPQSIAIKEVMEAVEKYIDNAPTIDAEPKWIPCSERLPELSEYVLVTYDFLGKKNIGIFSREWVEPNNIIWSSDDEYGQLTDEPIAWMPLPRPYERSESDD